jgi:hypothetical protein
MVAMGSAWMTTVHPDPFETLRAELVEALARMVHRVIESGKGEAQSALGQLERIRSNLVEVGGIDDFLADIDAAERALQTYLLT